MLANADRLIELQRALACFGVIVAHACTDTEHWKLRFRRHVDVLWIPRAPTEGLDSRVMACFDVKVREG